MRVPATYSKGSSARRSTIQMSIRFDDCSMTIVAMLHRVHSTRHVAGDTRSLYDRTLRHGKVAGSHRKTIIYNDPNNKTPATLDDFPIVPTYCIHLFSCNAGTTFLATRELRYSHLCSNQSETSTTTALHEDIEADTRQDLHSPPRATTNTTAANLPKELAQATTTPNRRPTSLQLPALPSQQQPPQALGRPPILLLPHRRHRRHRHRALRLQPRGSARLP